jgi:hypothetical protein
MGHTGLTFEGGRLLHLPIKTNMHKNTMASLAVLCGQLANTVSDPGKDKVFQVSTMGAYGVPFHPCLTSPPDGGE